MLIRLTMIVLSIIACSCSSSYRLGEGFSKFNMVPQEKAALYIYRPRMFYKGGAFPTIYINGEAVSDLLNGGYFTDFFDPGFYKILIKKNPKIYTEWFMPELVADIELEPGQEYFLRVTPRDTGSFVVGNVVAMSSSSSMDLVQKENAIKEISKTRRLYIKGSNTYTTDGCKETINC